MAALSCISIPREESSVSVNNVSHSFGSSYSECIESLFGECKLSLCVDYQVSDDTGSVVNSLDPTFYNDLACIVQHLNLIKCHISNSNMSLETPANVSPLHMLYVLKY